MENVNNNIWTATPTMNTMASPSYQFRSTSTYQPIVGHTSYTSELNAPSANAPAAGGPHRLRMEDNPWGKPTGEQAVGTIDTPVGEPLVLLVMAILYILYRRIHKSAL